VREAVREGEMERVAVLEGEMERVAVREGERREVVREGEVEGERREVVHEGEVLELGEAVELGAMQFAITSPADGHESDRLVHPRARTAPRLAFIKEAPPPPAAGTVARPPKAPPPPPA
jgi:hypothetical protein